MTDAFLAEIRMFSGNFAPAGWALCNGQLMPIAQNSALFALIGTTYGGNGTVTFALPNLQGSVPLQPGQGQGLSPRTAGEVGGSTTVNLSSQELPVHTHRAAVRTTSGNSTRPGGAVWATAAYGRQTERVYASGQAPNALMSPLSSTFIGGNQPHNNMPPYLAVTFIIALQGIFPMRP
ncbi:MAG: hypothetical protein QOK10_1838 [Pseudonocardiales bacterium]|nr:hypothetical protein [Pseudonocardiales bacterium]